MDQKQPPECSIKIGVFKKFAKFRAKDLCQRLVFNKVAGLRPAVLLKKRLWYRCFPVIFCGIFKSTFFTEHLRTTVSRKYLALKLECLFFVKVV